MIDPSWPKPIYFHKKDVPELPDVEPYDAEEEQRKDAETARQMEHDFGFRPFGWEW